MARHVLEAIQDYTATTSWRRQKPTVFELKSDFSRCRKMVYTSGILSASLNTSNAEDVSSVFSLPTETSDISSFRFIRISQYNMNTYLHFRERLGLASLRYRNRPGIDHCSYVWTEFRSGTGFRDGARAVRYRVWTKSLLKTFLTLVKLGQLLLDVNISLREMSF